MKRSRDGDSTHKDDTTFNDNTIDDLTLLEARILILKSADVGDLSCLKPALDLFPRLVNTQSTCGSTPLYLASESNHVACVNYLIQKGAANETQYTCCYGGKIGFSPLYIAAENGHTESLTLLIKRFPHDINKKSPSGATPLFVAAQNGHLECVKILLNNGADKNINFSDTLGNITPLETAKLNNFEDIINLLKN